MISIIIPIYNQANKLGKCLDSILRQSIFSINEVARNDNIVEAIVINDGSVDNPERVIGKHNDKLQITSYKLQVNKGAPAARNRGFKESRGEYLFFCDADAVLEPDCLEIMLTTLKEHKEASYVYSSFFWGRKLFKLFPFDENKLKQMPYIHTMSLIRREHFPKNGWDESIKKLQDWDLWLTMLEAGRKGYWIDKILFTVQPGGTISSWLPSCAYGLFPFLPSVKKYNQAVKIIKKKHCLK